jgi:hypothetical protein
MRSEDSKKMKPDGDLNILLKMDRGGWIRKIYVCSKNSDDAEIITRALSRIIKPSCFHWIRRLLNRSSGTLN